MSKLDYEIELSLSMGTNVYTSMTCSLCGHEVRHMEHSKAEKGMRAHFKEAHSNLLGD